MEDWWKPLISQAPGLVVLVILTLKFLQHLRAESDATREALREFRTTIEQQRQQDRQCEQRTAELLGRVGAVLAGIEEEQHGHSR